MSFPPPGNRDFTERDMVKVAAMHAESQAEIVELRAERDSLLAEWNALVSAIGSRTHGGAVGHGAALLAERDALRAENARDERGDLGPLTTLLAECADLRDRATAAEAENARLTLDTTWQDHADHWQKRAVKAEARVAELVVRIGELNGELHEKDSRRNQEVQNAYNDGYSSGFDAGKEGE